MSWIGETWRRVTMLLRGEKFAQELEEEFALHRELKRRELHEAGANQEEARYAANRAIGTALVVKERSADEWGWRWLTDFVQDARYGVRMLRKNPSFAVVACLTLALGIGANTTVFSLVHAALLRPLPFPHAKQVVFLNGRTEQMARTAISYPDFEDWQQRSHSFNGIAAWMPQSINLTGQERPERVRGAFVSANFFDVLGVRAEQGRTFLSGEDEPGRAGLAVVNHSLWIRRFGADPDFVGKRLVLNGAVFTVVGILPEEFDFPVDDDRNEVWLPVSAYPGFSRKRDHYNLFAIARLRDEVTVGAAQLEMRGIAKQLAQEFPEEDGQRAAVVRPLQEVATQDLRGLLLILQGAVALVLLIACANVVNLLLARTAARRGEISLRASLGASGTRLARQMLSETLVLWALAGVLGIGIGSVGLRLVLATSPVKLPPGSVADIGWPVLGFTALLTGLTAAVAGLVPALRYALGDIERGLREGGRAGEGAGASHMRSVLLVAQVAMSLMLLGAAGLMMRTMANLAAVQPGFQPKNVLTLEYRLPQTEYAKPEDQWNFHQRVTQEVTRIPGVRSASIAVGVPFTGNIGYEPIVLLDRAAPAPGQEPLAQHNYVDASYFETMQIAVLAGRSIDKSDGIDTTRVVVINNALAQQFWRNRDPLGRQIRLLDDQAPATIVGIVGDVRQDRLDEKPQPQIYFAYAQTPFRFATLIVRTESDPMGFVGPIRNAVWKVDRNQPMWKIRSLEAVMKNARGDRTYLGVLLGVYAMVATFLAAVGIYGVLSYLVNQRLREIGVRIALGAQARDTMGLIVGSGMKWVGAGIVAGLVGTLSLARVLAGMLYGVGPNDPLTLAAGATVLTLAALLACWIPARRASRVDPMRTLRVE